MLIINVVLVINFYIVLYILILDFLLQKESIYSGLHLMLLQFEFIDAKCSD